MYQEKIEGQPCPTCGVPMIMGKKGVYCLPCYKAWANQNKPQSPQTQYNAPQQAQPTQGIDLSQYLLKSEFEVILKRQRDAFTELTARMAEVTSQVEYFKELWKTQNPTAHEAHKDQLEEIPVIESALHLYLS